MIHETRRDKQSNPRKFRENLNNNGTRVFLLEILKNRRPNSNVSTKRSFLIYLGYACQAAGKKKSSSEKIPERHKGADLTSAFFPPSARIFITEETGALKFFSRLLAEPPPLPFYVNPLFSRENSYKRSTHHDVDAHLSLQCGRDCRRTSGFYIRAPIQTMFRNTPPPSPLLLPFFKGEGMILDTCCYLFSRKKASNFTLRDIIHRITIFFVYDFFLNIF